MKYKKPRTHKIWYGTLRKLRMIYAITGDSQVKILDRLVTYEFDRLQSEEDAVEITDED